jgi:flavin-dependent dehydrogenase
MPAPLIIAPLIIGGGPAGAAAAIVLAGAGQRPTLLERNPGPVDKVCGDFLSGEAIAMLRAFGLDIARMGAAPVRRVRLIHRRRIAEAILPFAAAGLSRRVLDEALLALAASRGATLCRGRAVHHLALTQNGTTARLTQSGENSSPSPCGRGLGGGVETTPAGDDIGNPAQRSRKHPATSAEYMHPVGPDGQIAAEVVFLATGKHNLRGWPRQPRPAKACIGLKTYLKLSRDQAMQLGDAVELVLFPGGYAGLQPVENGCTVLCALVSPESIHQAGGPDLPRMAAALSPHLQSRLEGAEPLLPRTLAVAGIPYGHLRAEASDPRLYRLGDQAAVIASLTGDGVSIALASGILAAESWLQGETAGMFHARFAALLRAPMQRAGLIQIASRSARLQPALVQACSGFPWLMRLAAQATRIGFPISTAEGKLNRVASP